MPVTENKALIDRAVDAFNRGDEAAVDALFAAGYVDHDPARAGLPPGPAGVKAAWRQFRTAFPDAEVRISEVVAAGDKVAVRGSIHGTHRGELMGIPPTGQAVTVTLIDVNRIAEGQLVERWAEADMLGLLQQLGAIPAPEHGEHRPSDQPMSRGTTGGRSLSAEENEAMIRRYWQDASTRGVLAVIDDYFAPDIIAHPPTSVSPEPIRGRDAWKQFTSAHWGAFPDLTATVEDVISEDDRVAVRLTARGTHMGPLMGLPPTGKPVSFSGMEIFRLANGTIAESWGQFDALNLLQQLGAVPTATRVGR